LTDYETVLLLNVVIFRAIYLLEIKKVRDFSRTSICYHLRRYALYSNIFLHTLKV